MSIIYQISKGGQVLVSGILHEGHTRISKAKFVKSKKNDAQKFLKTILKKGTTVYTQIQSTADSGLSRNLNCYIVRSGKIHNIGLLAGAALGWGVCYMSGSVTVKGTDIGAHLVRTLSAELFDDDQAIKQEWL